MKLMIVMSLILVPLVLLAAPPAKKTVPVPTSKAPAAASPKVYKKSETHLFSGSKLKGQLKKPDLSYIYQRKGLRAERIVKVPEDFNEEIIDGAGQF